MPTVELLIKGKVQGVFYRATARRMAKEIGITGWIKNTHQGDVQAIVTGTEEQLDKFWGWCKKGPEKSVVSEITILKKEESLFPDFHII